MKYDVRCGWTWYTIGTYNAAIITKAAVALQEAFVEYQLHLWQEKCLKEWKKKHCYGIVNVVARAGKTYPALAAGELFRERTAVSDLRIKIVVPTASLLAQWGAAIWNFFDGTVSRRDIGFYYSDQRDAPDRLFMIYVINSAHYSLARHIVRDLKEGFAILLIADKCHRYTGDENRKVFDFLPFTKSCPEQYVSLGLSATLGLNRPENASVLIPALGPEIFRYGLKEAEGDETFCPYAAFHIALSFTPQEKAEYEKLSGNMRKMFLKLISHYPSLRGLNRFAFFCGLYQIANEKGDYTYLARSYLNLSHKRKNFTSEAMSRLQYVTKPIGLLDKSVKIIIFDERIKQVDILYEKLDRLYPNQAVRCHSAMDPSARKLTLERFRDGEVRILIGCRALDKGFDVPSASVGIAMSSAPVNRQRIQRLGRILRQYGGKEITSLYYMYIAEPPEEASYSPVEPQTSVICELSYHWKNDTSSHPAYERRVRTAMQRLRRAKPDVSLLSEAVGCFERGIVGPDWPMGRAHCTVKIQLSEIIAERNYWICMKQIAR